MTSQEPFGSYGNPEPVGDQTVPADIIGNLRSVCLGLPEAYEEQAWVGTRWRIRGRTFAHVLKIASGWPPAYARVAPTDQPCSVLMFRSSGPELDFLRRAGPPFFAPPWRGDEVGIALSPNADWEEVAELLVESYRTQAPKRLGDSVDHPGPDIRKPPIAAIVQ